MTYLASKITGEHRSRAFMLSLMFASAGLFAVATAASIVDVAGGIMLAIAAIGFLHCLHRTGGW